MMVDVRFAARDPGGANVLAALVNSLPGTAFSMHAWTLPRGASLHAVLPNCSRIFQDPPDSELLERAWDEQPAALLVTGTSHYAPFEQTLWQIAAERGVPSLAILDQWMNLAPRFSLSKPAFVGALDLAQAKDLVGLGFTRDRVVLMGHPGLSRLAKQRHRAPRATSARTRVLFVGEPIRSDVAQGVNEPFGFDEFDVFNLVHAAAVDAARGGARVSLAVRCHPYEDVASFERHVDGLAAVDGLDVEVLAAGGTALDEVSRADVVVGISSMLLMEAMVLGCAVVSLQPHLSRENTFEPSARGYARTLTDPAEARRIVAALIAHDAARADERERHRAFVQEVAADSSHAFIEWVRRVAPGAVHGHV